MINEIQMKALCKRAMQSEVLQQVQDAIFPRGKPGSLPVSLNASTTRKLKFPQWLSHETSAWADVDGCDRGPDVVALIVHMAALEHDDENRQRAAVALRDFLNRLPEPTPPPLRPVIESHEVTRTPAKPRGFERTPSNW